MQLSRRSFLGALGLGGAAVAMLPLEEIIDRLEFARRPTTSIYLPSSSIAVQQWDDDCFIEYVKSTPFFVYGQNSIVRFGGEAPGYDEPIPSEIRRLVPRVRGLLPPDVTPRG